MVRTFLRWFLVLLLCLLFLGALAIVFDGVYHSSHLQECVSQRAGQPILPFVTKLRLYRDCAGLFVEKYGEPTTAFFTIVLALSTIGLWLVTQRSVSIANRTLTDLERPYIFILDFNWLLIAPNNSEAGWVYTVANGGRLPATIKRVSVGIDIRRKTIPVPTEQPAIHELLTAPLVAGGERRKVTLRFATLTYPVLGLTPPEFERHQVRDGSALIPTLALGSGAIIKISLEYDGPITTGHITTACWKWDRFDSAFTQYGGRKHNRRT